MDFKYILLNHEAEKKMPLSLGKNLLDTQPGVVEDTTFEAFKQVVETGISQQYEKYNVQFDEWYCQSVVKLGDGVTTTTSDITQRKKAEESLRQSKDLLQKIIDAPNIGMAVYKAIRNDTGEITDYYHEYINRSSIEMLGEDFTGRLFSEHGESALSQMLQFKEVIDGGKRNSYIQEIDFRGRKVWFAITNTPIGNDRLVHTWEDITERKKSQQQILQLKEEIAKTATDKYYSIFNSIDEGFCIYEIIYDENNKPIDLKWVEVNPAYENQTGLTDVTGKRHSDLNMNTESCWLEIYDRVCKTGEVLRFEQWHQGTRRWYYTFTSRMGDKGSKQVAVVFTDITERKEREANLAFLAELMKDFAPLGSVEEIMKTAAARILSHLQLSQCSFIEVNYPLRECTILYNLRANGAPSMTGTYKLTDYHTEEENRLLASGQPMIINNVEDGARSPEKAAAFRDIDVGSVVNIPYLINGKWVFNLGVTRSGASQWSKGELELLQEVCSRLWIRIERAKAEEMLRISEEKYRTLFESMDEGFCLLELVYDENRNILDMIYRAQNPAFDKHSGLGNVEGKKVSEVLPNMEQYWKDVYTEVARTGETVTGDNYVQDLDRWFRIRLMKIGGIESPFVAVTFEEITERKQSELRKELRFRLSEALRNTSDPLEIEEKATQLAMEYFNADRCYYAVVYGETVSISCDASSSNLASVAGDYPIAEFAIFRKVIDTGKPLVVNDAANTEVLDEPLSNIDLQFNRVSFIDIPVIKNGQVHGIFSVMQSQARSWNEGQVQMAQEIADRIWTAVERANAEKKLAEDLKDTKKLQQISNSFVEEDGLHALYDKILNTIMDIMDADFASMQLLLPDNQLFLLAHKNLHPASVKHWEYVHITGTSACGRALADGQRVIVPDLDNAPFEMDRMEYDAYKLSGISAVQSTPLISRSGKTVGMVSTHWRNPYQPAERQLNLLDIVARQLADLIERKNSEAALRKSEEKYRTLFEGINDGFTIIEVLFDENGNTADYRFIETNPAFTRQTGIEQGVQKTMREIAPAHEEFWFEMYGEIAKTGVPRHFEHKTEALGRYYEVFAFRIGDPAQHRVAIVFNDISERRRSEEAMRISEEKYRTIFNTIDVGFVFCEAMMDEKGHITDILYLDNNPASAKIMGQDYKGKKASELYPATKDYWCRRAEHVLKNNKGERYEFYSELAGRHIGAYAVKIPALGENMLAIVFQEAIETKKE